MTPTNGIQYGSGFRHGTVFEIDQTTGRLKGNSATIPYLGETWVGAKAWNLNIPKQRRINHIDADRVAAADFLPPTEAAGGTINVSADNMQLDEILTGNKQALMGDADTIADLTSNQGFEPLVSMMLWQQSLDSVTRLRTWRVFLIPRAKAIPMLSGFADKEVDGTYDVMMTPSSQNIFGAAMTKEEYGATDAQLFRAMTKGRPKLAAWLGDGYVDTFTFPTDYSPAISVDSVVVYVDGVLVSAGITVTTTNVVFDTAPVAGADINIFWQY